MILKRCRHFSRWKQVGMQAIILKRRVERALIVIVVETSQPNSGAQPQPRRHCAIGLDGELSVGGDWPEIEARIRVETVACGDRVIVNVIPIRELLEKTQP